MKLDFKDIYRKSIDKPEDFWKEISRKQSSENGLNFSFVEYQRN